MCKYCEFIGLQIDYLGDYLVDTMQDFLFKLSMKPHIPHLVEISIFSLNPVIVRATKIIRDQKRKKYSYLIHTYVLNTD